VPEPRGRAGLAPEALHEHRVVAELAPQQLQRHRAVELQVARPIDVAHAAAPERGLDPIAPGERRPDQRVVRDRLGRGGRGARGRRRHAASVATPRGLADADRRHRSRSSPLGPRPQALCYWWDRTTVAALASRLEADASVVAAWLFGSEARGDVSPGSDVDVAVFVARPRPSGTLDDLPLTLQADLSQLLGREVDVVVVDWAPSDLVHRVLRDGRLLVDRDRRARIRFEVAARNRYFDMQPIWRRYRRNAG